MENKNKIILDLCGGTGSWSRPYVEAGYKVILITWPEFDVNKVVFYRDYMVFPGKTRLIKVRYDKVHGVLAAPPCTMFSFARTNAKKPRDLKEGMWCVRSCLNIVWHIQEHQQPTNSKVTTLAWWALENPYHGLLKRFIGAPAFTFDPYEFGDGYKKRTALWGYFKHPRKVKGAEKPRTTWASKKFDRLKSHEIHPEYFGKYDRTTRRSITPAGFAKAFFKANQ